MFSQLAAARGSIISGPVSRSATAFNFLHSGSNSAYGSFDYPESGRISFPRQVSRRQAAQGTSLQLGSGPVPDGAKLFLAFGSHRGAVREFRWVAAPGPDMNSIFSFRGLTVFVPVRGMTDQQRDNGFSLARRDKWSMGKWRSAGGTLGPESLMVLWKPVLSHFAASH
jgi:hypothetical protein